MYRAVYRISVIILLGLQLACVVWVGPKPVNDERSEPERNPERHSIAGSSSYFNESWRYSTLKNIRINELNIRVVRGKDTDCYLGYNDHLELDGPIGEDSTHAVTEILSQLKQCFSTRQDIRVVTRVYLNSSGGLMKDGLALGRLFKRHGVQAEVMGGQRCSSSCAIAFLGAKFRRLSYDGALLFHAPYHYQQGGRRILCSRPDDAGDLRQYYVEMLGQDVGQVLFDRTMSYCGVEAGWTINRDAAATYKITNTPGQ